MGRYMAQFRRLGSIEFENDCTWDEQAHAEMYVRRVMQRCQIDASGQVFDTQTRRIVFFYDRITGEREIP